MAQVLDVTTSYDGMAAYIKDFPDSGANRTSGDDASFNIVVPNDPTIDAIFPSANGDFYMSKNDDAANPGPGWSYTTQELNPGPRKCFAGQTIYFYTPKACNITLAFHRLKGG